MRIRGTFPGGPTHPASSPEPRPTPAILSVGSLEVYLAHRRLRRQEARRAVRRVLLVSAVCAAALAIGGVLGRASRITPNEEVASRGPRASLDRFISQEVNRTLLQLWKMEDLEALRGGRRSR